MVILRYSNNSNQIRKLFCPQQHRILGIFQPFISALSVPYAYHSCNFPLFDFDKSMKRNSTSLEKIHYPDLRIILSHYFTILEISMYDEWGQRRELNPLLSGYEPDVQPLHFSAILRVFSLHNL